MPDMPVCPSCKSELVVPKYVKRSQLEAFKKGESVDFCAGMRAGVVRVLICDDCKEILPDQKT